MSRLKALIPSLASGLLFTGAFPPFRLWWLAWVWALPLLWLLWNQGERRGWRLAFFGFRHAWLAGFIGFTSTLWWVGHVNIWGMLAMCVYLALYPGVWGGIAAMLRPNTPLRGLLSAIAVAGIWCGLEWARGILLTGFPWNGAAVPLVEMPGLRSLASFTGVTGLSILPLFFMAGIAAAWALRTHPSVRARAFLMAVSMGTPAVVTLITWQRSPEPFDYVQVMLVQPNVSMEMKMSPDQDGLRYEELIALTVEAYMRTADKPDMIVWPESAIPGYFHDPRHEAYLRGILDLGPLTLITGCDALTAEGTGNTNWAPHNCVAILRGTPDNFTLHPKVHLVPFGEYIPLRRQLPWLEDILGDLIPSDFSAGTSLEPLRTEGVNYEVIPLVCFEDTIADLARRFVRNVPQIMVNVTNDNWFRESSESAIHALNARWRCLELQRPMIRAANTGVTCVIDTEGRVTSELRPFTKGVLHAAVPLTHGGITFFAAHGEIVSICAGVVGLLLAATLLLTLRSPAR